MKRQIVFSGDKAVERFRLCFEGFCIGQSYAVRQDKRGEAQPRDERRTDVAVLKGLKSVSDVDPHAEKLALAPDSIVERRAVRLGETLTLDQVQLDRLVKLMERVPWGVDHIEAVEDALDWLAAADKIEE